MFRQKITIWWSGELEWVLQFSSKSVQLLKHTLFSGTLIEYKILKILSCEFLYEPIVFLFYGIFHQIEWQEPRFSRSTSYTAPFHSSWRLCSNFSWILAHPLEWIRKSVRRCVYQPPRSSRRLLSDGKEYASIHSFCSIARRGSPIGVHFHLLRSRIHPHQGLSLLMY